MFVRWVDKQITGFEGNWGVAQSLTGLASHSAALLHSYRENGKPRQQRVASLGVFHTRNGQLVTKEGRVSRDVAHVFQLHATRVLDGLDISDDDRAKAEQQLSDKIGPFVEATA